MKEVAPHENGKNREQFISQESLTEDELKIYKKEAEDLSRSIRANGGLHYERLDPDSNPDGWFRAFQETSAFRRVRQLQPTQRFVESPDRSEHKG